jgi:hypothetical protein
MNDARLKALIEEADASLPAQSASSPDFAGRVRALHRRRQRRKLVFAIAALVGVGGLLWHELAGRPSGELAKSVPVEKPAAPTANAVAAEERLRETRKQIDREELIIERLLAQERARRLAAAVEAAPIAFDRQLLVAEQVGQAAMALLLTGDQRANRPGGAQAARDDYVLVMQVFPNTIWAQRAGERLAALKP